MLEWVRDYSFELLVSVISSAELILKGSEWYATEFLWLLLVYLHREIYKLMTWMRDKWNDRWNVAKQTTDYFDNRLYCSFQLNRKRKDKTDRLH